MERTLEVLCDGTPSSFAVSKLGRATLYGSRHRVPVDAQGRECSTAALTRDGRFLLPPGSTATLYLDDNDDVVERDELQNMDAEGNTPGPVESSPADTPEPVAEPGDPRELLDYSITRVYALDPISVCAKLDALLASCVACRLPSQRGPAPRRQESFLLKNEVGYFLLVGEQAGFEFVGPDQADLSLPDTDESWDEIDFAMM